MNKQQNSEEDSSSQKPKQPGGFYVLFLTEMWERFGFYMITSLLVLYLTKAMGYSDDMAYTIFATFSALLYITPSVGGYVADRYLGYRKTMALGSVLLTVGYALLALPNPHAVYPALACVIIGMGFFKSMPYALLNQLYRSKTERKRMDSAFTLYYLSIQIGGVWPSIIGGYTTRYLGWHITFSLAAFGMFIGVLTYFFGWKYFKKADIDVGYRKTSKPFILTLAGISLAATVAITVLLVHSTITNIVVWTMTLIMLAYVFLKSRQFTRKEQMRVLVAVTLTALGAVFFILYYQQAMSLTLFVDRNVNRQFFGSTIPAAAYWALNPIAILIIGPILSVMYRRLAEINKDPSIAMKFGIGTILMGLGYLLITFATHFAGKNGHISSGWIVGSYALQSTAELLVNALGTAMIVKLVPKALTSVMIGFWFIATAIGGLLSGTFAQLTAIPKNELSKPFYTLHVYAHAFSIFAWFALSIGIVACVAAPVLTRWSEAKAA